MKLQHATAWKLRARRRTSLQLPPPLRIFTTFLLTAAIGRPPAGPIYIFTTFLPLINHEHLFLCGRFPFHSIPINCKQSKSSGQTTRYRLSPQLLHFLTNQPTNLDNYATSAALFFLKNFPSYSRHFFQREMEVAVDAETSNKVRAVPVSGWRQIQISLARL